MNVLSHDSLWQKTKLYARRAMATSHDDPTFGLWATLALEFLARSSLASVHPVLVADPQEPQYLLYAFGFRFDRAPRSIPAKAVFARCQMIVPNFTDQERTFCMKLVERRNAELHSGHPAFHEHPSSEWLVNYYTVCEMLLKFQDRGLGHMFGGEAAKTARKLIKAAESNVRGRVLEELHRHKVWFEAQGVDAQKTLTAEAGAWANITRLTTGLARATRCPCCESLGAQRGQRIRTSEPMADEDSIYVKTVVLPTRFECRACNLRLNGHAQLHFADLGDEFTVTEFTDATDYFGLVYPGEPEDYEEYMNE